MKEEFKRKGCILVADDDPGVRRLLRDVLTEAGFEVISAANGRAALTAARKHPGNIDLLVTDVEMPQVDGFDLQERLRRERPEMKLLVISGALGSNIQGTDFRLIRKPFDASVVVSTAKELLRS